MWWWMRLVVYIFKFSPLGSTVFPKSPLVIHIMCEFVWGMSMESKIEWSSTLISVGNFLNGKKSHVHSFFFPLPLAMCVLWFQCWTSSTGRKGCVLSAEILFPMHMRVLYSFWTLEGDKGQSFSFHVTLFSVACPPSHDELSFPFSEMCHFFLLSIIWCSDSAWWLDFSNYFF